jgi:hypothetical protein
MRGGRTTKKENNMEARRNSAFNEEMSIGQLK